MGPNSGTHGLRMEYAKLYKEVAEIINSLSVPMQEVLETNKLKKLPHPESDQFTAEADADLVMRWMHTMDGYKQQWEPFVQYAELYAEVARIVKMVPVGLQASVEKQFSRLIKPESTKFEEVPEPAQIKQWLVDLSRYKQQWEQLVPDIGVAELQPEPVEPEPDVVTADEATTPPAVSPEAEPRNGVPRAVVTEWMNQFHDQVIELKQQARDLAEAVAANIEQFRKEYNERIEKGRTALIAAMLLIGLLGLWLLVVTVRTGRQAAQQDVTAVVENAVTEKVTGISTRLDKTEKTGKESDLYTKALLSRITALESNKDPIELKQQLEQLEKTQAAADELAAKLSDSRLLDLRPETVDTLLAGDVVTKTDLEGKVRDIVAKQYGEEVAGIKRDVTQLLAKLDAKADKTALTKLVSTDQLKPYLTEEKLAGYLNQRQYVTTKALAQMNALAAKTGSQPATLPTLVATEEKRVSPPSTAPTSYVPSSTSRPCTTARYYYSRRCR